MGLVKVECAACVATHAEINGVQFARLKSKVMWEMPDGCMLWTSGLKSLGAKFYRYESRPLEIEFVLAGNPCNGGCAIFNEDIDGLSMRFTNFSDKKKKVKITVEEL